MRHLTSVQIFLRDDSGQDLTEYGLLASLIAIVAIVTVGDVGVQVNEFWTYIIGELEGIL